jgi:hypothetical protein
MTLEKEKYDKLTGWKRTIERHYGILKNVK